MGFFSYLTNSIESKLSSLVVNEPVDSFCCLRRTAVAEMGSTDFFLELSFEERK